MRRAIALVTLACAATAGCAERRSLGSGPPPSSRRPPAGDPEPASAPLLVSASAVEPLASADAAAPSAASAPLPERLDDMLLVPGGTFVMGADRGGERDEHPEHEVTVASFYLDETEVTNEAYAPCIEAGLCRPPYPKNAEANHVGPDKRFRGPRQPISSISWDDARAYCQWRKKRLPTEAEWERAARGDDKRRFPWGNEGPTPERAVYHTSVTADVATHPLGVGPYGHHDLAGNVWEWVEDVYDPYAYTRPGAARGVGGTCEESLAAFEDLRRKKLDGFTGLNPIPDECERVLRGGAFNYGSEGLRSTNRVHHPPRYRLVMSGFRCARDARP